MDIIFKIIRIILETIGETIIGLAVLFFVTLHCIALVVVYHLYMDNPTCNLHEFVHQWFYIYTRFIVLLSPVVGGYIMDKVSK